MFEVLPIKHIREEDLPLIGKGLVSLSKLYHLGLPIADGIIVLPPQIKLKTILEHFQSSTYEIFEQSLNLIKADIKKIEVPEELVKELLKQKIEPKKVWSDLLETWILEIRAIIFREGFSPNLTSRLSAQPVFYTKKILFSGEGYFNGFLKQAVINSNNNLTIEQTLELEELIKKADKKLFLPHIYIWIFDGKFKIVKVKEFTEHQVDDLAFDSSLENYPKESIKKTKSAVKVFLNIAEGLVVDRDVDGFIFESEKIDDYESKIWRYSEIATDFPSKPVIFKLADVKDHDLRGTLRLIHQQSLLKKEAESFLFARNKKGLFNTQIAIPYLRSVNELLQIKRDLAGLGISRKGSLKMWMEIAVPENVVNLEDYLVAGVDGVIINLDSISSLLGGFDHTRGESTFYFKQAQALLSFLEDALKLLKKSAVPVLFGGELISHDEVISFLIEKGVFGVVVSMRDANAIQEHLSFVEKRVIKARLTN